MGLTTLKQKIVPLFTVPSKQVEVVGDWLTRRFLRSLERIYDGPSKQRERKMLRGNGARLGIVIRRKRIISPRCRLFELFYFLVGLALLQNALSRGARHAFAYAFQRKVIFDMDYLICLLLHKLPATQLP